MDLNLLSSIFYQKKLIQVIVYLTILFSGFYGKAWDEKQENLSVWASQKYNSRLNLQVDYNYDQLQQDPYNFITLQNSSFSSLTSNQDWYQQYRNFILSHIEPIFLQGKVVKITREDRILIDRICNDNPHKNENDLRTKLSASSSFNVAQYFLKAIDYGMLLPLISCSF